MGYNKNRQAERVAGNGKRHATINNILVNLINEIWELERRPLLQKSLRILRIMTCTSSRPSGWAIATTCPPAKKEY